jgi:hypothetical protein
MAISKYECRRSEHVLLKVEELRQLLESSKTFDGTMNKLILGYATCFVLHRSAMRRAAQENPTKWSSKSVTVHVGHSEWNVCRVHIQNEEKTTTKEIEKNQKSSWQPTVHLSLNLFCGTYKVTPPKSDR